MKLISPRHVLSLTVLFVWCVGCGLTPLKQEESSFHHSALGTGSTKCVLVVRRLARQEHFDFRFNQHGALGEAEEGLRALAQNAGWSKEVKVLSSSLFRTEDAQDVRSLAALSGCDRVFAFRETVIRDTSVNLWSLTYPTLVGLFIFPGNNLQVGVRWEFELLEVTTGKKIAEGQLHGLSPLYHFRPGSLSWVEFQGYRYAASEALAEGRRLILAAKESPK